MGSARSGARRATRQAPAALPSSARLTAAPSAPAAVRRREPPAEIGSRNIPDDERADQSRDGHGQRLPYPDQPCVFRVLRAKVGDGATVAGPLVPMERHGVRAPLLLESKGATVRR